VRSFFSHVQALVDSAVANYRERGFSSLMVSFGCTGGQHRSVYMAEHLAEHLRQAGVVNVVLRHVELEKKGLAE
jgi:RNase adaptor protein for sRNA GlmZ degradation